LGPTLFLLYTNDLLAVINKKAIPVLFADDTSILFTHRNFMELHVNIETVLRNVNIWFKKTAFHLKLKKLTAYTSRQRTANPLT